MSLPLAGPISASASWEIHPCRMPQRDALLSVSTILLQGKIAVFGDRTSHIFDPNNPSQPWTKLPATPKRHLHCAVVCDEETVFVIGGSHSNDIDSITLDQSNTAKTTSCWQRLPPMEARRMNCAAAMVQNKDIVVAGGGYRLVQTAEMLHRDSLTWSWLPNMSEPRRAFTAAAVGNKFFVFGGFDQHVRPLRTAEVLDLSTKTWEALPSMPHCHVEAATVTVGRFILLIGGHDENYNPKPGFVDCFDTVRHEWVAGTGSSDNNVLCTPRSHCGAALVGDEIFVFGGYDAKNKSLDTIEKIKIHPYWIMTPKLTPLFHQENVPLGLWSHILAKSCNTPSVIYFILLSERFQLDSVLLQASEQNNNGKQCE